MTQKHWTLKLLEVNADMESDIKFEVGILKASKI